MPGSNKVRGQAEALMDTAHGRLLKTVIYLMILIPVSCICLLL